LIRGVMEPPADNSLALAMENAKIWREIFPTDTADDTPPQR